MFEIVLLKKHSNKLMLSGNPILYQGVISPPPGFNSLFIKASLYLLLSDTTLQLVKSEVIIPDEKGGFIYDISSLVEAYLEYFVPPANLDNIVECTKQLRKFSLKLDLYNTSNNNSVESSTVEVVYVLKGGTSYEYFLPEPGNIISANEEHWLLSTDTMEKVMQDEYFWLNILLPADEGKTYYFDYHIKYLDNAGVEQEYTDKFLPAIVASDRPKAYCFPGGFKQNNFHTKVPAGCIPISYWFDIYFKTPDIARRNFEPYPVFEIDHRNFPNNRKLVYRSSLGSLMPVCLKGDVEEEGVYENQTSNTRPLEWITNLNVNAAIQQTRSLEDYKFKGETGFITKYQAGRIRDLFLSDNRYEYVDGRLVPVIINSKNVKYYSNKDSLYSIMVEWQYAWRNNYHSDKDVAGDTCPAMLFFKWEFGFNNTIKIYYALPAGYNFFRVQIDLHPLRPEFVYVEGNAGTAIIGYTPREMPPDVEAVMEVSAAVMCNRYNRRPNYGPLYTTDSQVVPETPPAPLKIIVGNDTYSILPGATTGITFDVPVLNNDYDTAGDPLEVVAVTNVATTQGGVITINAAGVVTYTPPDAGFTGTDTYTYSVRNVGGTDTVDGIININVTASTSGLWAGVFNDEIQTIGFGFFYNKHYIALFSSATASVPSAGTAVVNYRKKVTVYENPSGLSNGWLVISETNTDLNITFTNEAKKLIFEGNPEVFSWSGTPFLSAQRKTVTELIVLPGSGYTVY